MCRMIAKISKEETSIINEMLSCPYSLQYLSENGRQIEDPETRGLHKDGCGIALVSHDNIVIEKRGRENAWDDSYIEFVKSAASKIFIGHNRLTSEGLESNVEGSHPFYINTGKEQFAFSHNGTVYNFVEEAAAQGTSDSFIFFNKLISGSEENTPKKITSRLRKIVNETSYSSLTGFLMGNDFLMVWRIFDEKDLSKVETRDKYYTMFMKEKHNSILFSSEPLDDDKWKQLPNHAVITVSLKENMLDITKEKLLAEYMPN